MANRFWVGGTATWNATAGTKWATTTGGAGGAAVPTASDDVFLDGASGAVTVTLEAGYTALCRSFNGTGFTGTLIGGGVTSLNIGTSTAGNFTIGSGMTFSTPLNFVSTTGTNLITMNGNSLTQPVSFNGSGGSWQFQDGFTVTDDLTLSDGTLDTNGKTVSISGIFSAQAGTLTLGASVISLSRDMGNVLIFNAAITLTANTSTINLTSASANDKIFSGAGKTFNNLNITGGGAGTWTFTDSDTFNVFTVNSPKTIIITSGKTLTFTQLNIAGSSHGSAITLQSTTPGSQASISQASGSVAGTYLSIKDSNAIGGATFTARYSIDVSGNSGWNFLHEGGLLALFDAS